MSCTSTSILHLTELSYHIMHLLNSAFSVLALFLLIPAFFANPTSRSLNARFNAYKTTSSIGGPTLQEIGTPKAYRGWPSSPVPSSPESDRSRSLMILGRRDLSQIKQILHAIWQDYVPFASADLQTAAATVEAMFSGIKDLVAGHAQQQYENALSFTYGAFKVVIRCGSQAMSWDTVDEVIQWIDQRIVKGFTGFFQANFIMIGGALIVVSYGVIIGSIFWLAQIPPHQPNYDMGTVIG